MELGPAFHRLVQSLAPAMTTPTFAPLLIVLTGWAFASRPTVTRIILAAG